MSLSDIFEKYKLPNVESDAIVKRWKTDWLSFWQNQLNFAIWCATTDCGVDYNHHLKADAMVGSLFIFHVYYQTRRILFEMGWHCRRIQVGTPLLIHIIKQHTKEYVKSFMLMLTPICVKSNLTTRD